jgi:hypothetical protein
MKRSKRKSGSWSSTKQFPKEHLRREPVELQFPSAAAWTDIVRDLDLSTTQAQSLETTLNEALEDIGRYRKKLQSQSNRPLLLERLKTFAKALGELEDECRRSADLMHDFLPHDTLEYTGRSLTFSAIGEALGRSVVPKNFDSKMEAKQLAGERISASSIEDLSRGSREALGLKYGHLILTHFLERIRAPLAGVVELKRLDKGGRPADAERRYLIYRLAEAAPKIIGRPSAVAVTGKFVDLCTAVLVACGLPEAGIAKAIPPVVRKLRAEQAKWRGRRAE